MPTGPTRRLLLALVPTEGQGLGLGMTSVDSRMAASRPSAVDPSPDPSPSRGSPTAVAAPQHCASILVTVPPDELPPELRRRVEELSAGHAAETGVRVVSAVQRTVERHCFATEQERHAFYGSRGLDPSPRP